MARDLEDEMYYIIRNKEGKIPVNKWTAPEVGASATCN